MEILDFVDSNAIANHLRKIDYKFSAVQKAFLIAMSSKSTIERKHKAFEDVIATEVDEKIERRLNVSEYPSLFAFLRRYMEIEDELVDEFRNAKNAVYRFRYMCACDGSFCEDFETVYPTLASCEQAYKKDIASYAEKVRFYEIRMDSLAEIGKYIKLKYTPKGEPLEIDANGLGEECAEILSVFEGMWFDIPTPFKRGDILIARRQYWIYDDPDPVVVDYLTTWSGDTFTEKGIMQTERERDSRNRLYERYVKDGDISDMCICGYFGCEDGGFYRETSYSLLDYEYYDKPIMSGNRILRVLSDYMKGKVDIDDFVKLAKYINSDENRKADRNYIHLNEEYLKIINI